MVAYGISIFLFLTLKLTVYDSHTPCFHKRDYDTVRRLAGADPAKAEH